MKVRIEGGNGFTSRFKIWDVETGQKLGLVKTAQLKVDTVGSCLQLVRQDPETLELFISPWMRGKWEGQDSPGSNREFIFESEVGWQPYAKALEEVLVFHNAGE